jgi:subtilisin family serine protease
MGGNYSLSAGMLFASAFMVTTSTAVSSGAAERASLLAAIELGTVLDPRLALAAGTVQVVVQLDDPPLAAMHSRNAKNTGNWLPEDQQRAHVAKLNAKQDAFMVQVRNRGGTELARMGKALNAVAISIDAAQLRGLAAQPNVISMRPVMDYRLDLSETVPYVGAAAVQTAGFDGTGVRVAVIDSGVDYTHRNFEGPGTLAAYAAAYGTGPTDPLNTTLDGLFPTAKVIGGYDFVGEAWPDKPLAPDPDPIDFQGHGTHVADIIAGHSLDGLHKGVAPGAKVIALRACSSVATACSGVALLRSMDFALDPNGDANLSDAVDVINMSLGSAYGQREDDLSAASANAVRLGVVVVASSGNNGDKPYVTGSPGSTPEVISVAQTQVPGAKRIPLVINSPAAIAGTYPNTESVDWAPIDTVVSGDVAYVGRGCPGDTYLADPAGKIALIDRGFCGVSLKVDRAAKAGAVGVLVAMVDASDPISFSFGGGDTFVPTLIIPKAVGDRIKANLTAPVNVTISPANGISLAGSMANTSARGPGYSDNAIKPDLGAPGASVSAQVGTGDGETAFGGTSGAAPMVSGAAALLVQAFPRRSPFEIKALLMNSAETSIQIDPALQPGVLAPITRIGGGELRADRALRSTTAAWDAAEQTGSLSFGYHALSGPATFARRILVRNYSGLARTYSITSSFRYANDAASGAVRLTTPAAIRVRANSTEGFEVRLSIDPSKLPTWNLNGGQLGGAGSRLQGVEFDGYVNIADANDDVHLAWHVLPHKAAAVSAQVAGVRQEPNSVAVALSNGGGATAGGIEVFSLTGQSPRIGRNLLPGPGDSFSMVDLRSVGVRLVNQGGVPGVQFGINTFGQRSHPNYPALFDVLIDNNLDGAPDFEVFNQELGGFAATGQNAVWIYNVATKTQSAFFYTDADLNSANVILTAPLPDLGLTPGTQFQFTVLAIDNYFTGNVTDAIGDMTYTLNAPIFSVQGGNSFALPAGTQTELKVLTAPEATTASPSQTGLLLLYRDARAGREADVIPLDF